MLPVQAGLYTLSEIQLAERFAASTRVTATSTICRGAFENCCIILTVTLLAVDLHRKYLHIAMG